MERDKVDFGNEKISRLFRTMFIPTLIGMLFNSVLNLCDGMFVGHGVGSDGLAAINIVAPLFLLCTGVGLMFGTGASVICGIRMAEGNEKSARIITTQSIAAGAALFMVVIALCLCFTRPILYALGCSPMLEDYAADYMLWLLPGLIFLYLECVGMMLIRQDGAPRYAMTIQVIAAVLNIFLDWLLVFPMGLGLKGAAIATSISCGVGGVLVLIYFITSARVLRLYPLKLTGKSLRLSMRNIGYMTRIGLATFIAELAIGVMMVTGNYMFMSYLGENGVAAFSIGCYLFPIIFSINNAVAQSAQPIISYNYGAGNTERVKATLITSLVAASICGLLVSLGMWRGYRLAHKHIHRPTVSGGRNRRERAAIAWHMRYFLRSQYILHRLLPELRTRRQIYLIHVAAGSHFHGTVVHSTPLFIRYHRSLDCNSGFGIHDPDSHRSRISYSALP